MKQFLLVLTLLAGFCSLHAQETLAPGSPMPKGDLKMKDISGTLVSLNEARSNAGLLVMFSCNTCPYVIRNQSRTKEILAYALQKGLGVIVLNSNDGNRTAGDSYADMQEYARRQNYKWRYALDSHNEIADAFGANRTPECFLFDGNMKLVYHGAIDDNPGDESQVSRKHLREAIGELLDGKDVSVKQSRSVGCTIARRN